MMTIKEFANLCICNTQTLRYYDKIDLLKPVKVDPWSGYRYYTKSQAIDFVKIKNLQAADFTIDEIKTLLTLSDKEIYDAFEQKIVEQTQKLERIKEIRQSYLTEKSNMEKLISGLSDFLTSQLTDFEILREFGLTPEEGPEVVARIKSYIEEQTRSHLPAEPDVTMIVNDRVIRGAEHVADAICSFTESNLNDTILLGDETVSEDDGFVPEEWETIWERHGWEHVYEFIDTIPQMQKEKEYCFCIRHTNEKYLEGISFPMVMISTMLLREKAGDISFSCEMTKSIDGQNHFSLMQKK